MIQPDRAGLEIVYELLAHPLSLLLLLDRPGPIGAIEHALLQHLAQLPPISVSENTADLVGQARRLGGVLELGPQAAGRLEALRPVLHAWDPAPLRNALPHSRRDARQEELRSCRDRLDELTVQLYGGPLAPGRVALLRPRERRTAETLVGHLEGLIAAVDLRRAALLRLEERLNHKHDARWLVDHLTSERRLPERVVFRLQLLADRSPDLVIFLSRLARWLEHTLCGFPEEIQKANHHLDLSVWFPLLTAGYPELDEPDAGLQELHCHLTSALPFRWLWLECMATGAPIQSYEVPIQEGLLHGTSIAQGAPIAHLPTEGWWISQVIGTAFEAFWSRYRQLRGAAPLGAVGWGGPRSSLRRATRTARDSLNRWPWSGRSSLHWAGNGTQREFLRWRSDLAELDVYVGNSGFFGTLSHLQLIYRIARSATYRALTVQRLQGGLEVFTDHYSLYTRYKKLRRDPRRLSRWYDLAPGGAAAERQAWRFAHTRWLRHTLTQAAEDRVDHLELRLAAEEHFCDTQHALCAFRAAIDQAGWCPANRAPGGGESRARTCGLIIHAKRQIHATNQSQADEVEAGAIRDAKQLCLAHDSPGLEHYLVAFDVAATEAYSSVRQFIAAYDIVRTHNRTLRKRRPQAELAFTYHAGEDRCSFVSELYSIADVLNLLHFNGRKQRIGHGFALGLDPRLVHDRRYTPERIPRLQYLVNLLHDRRLIIQCDLPLYLRPALAHRYLIETEVRIRDLVAGTVGTRDLDALTSALLDPGSGEIDLGIDRSDFVPLVIESSRPEEQSIRQAYLLWLVRRAGVTIEVCPTSNLIIRGLPDYSFHPLFFLAAVGIPFAVCTDNPGVMGIRLLDEFRRTISSSMIVDAARRRVHGRLLELMELGRRIVDRDGHTLAERFGLPDNKDQVREWADRIRPLALQRAVADDTRAAMFRR